MSKFKCASKSAQVQVSESAHLATEATAPPGAHTDTPAAPSAHGPRELQLKAPGALAARMEYAASIISADTYAPTPAGPGGFI